MLEARDVEYVTRFLGAQIERLAQSASLHARFLYSRLCIRGERPLPLGAYVRKVAELRADVFQHPAALEDLFASFCEYVLPVPAEEPALATRIDEEARSISRNFDPTMARSLLAQGPAIVEEVGRRWAWDLIDQVLPIPPYVPAEDEKVLFRRGHTVQALIEAFVRELERVWGAATRPAAPHVADLSITLARKPGEPWPDTIPEEPPVGAHLVVGLEGTPAASDEFLSVFHLSPDSTNERWVLWSLVEDDDDDDDVLVYLVPAPAAWCPKLDLAPVDAAFLLLEALLTRDLAAHGDAAQNPAAPRPRAAMEGILDRDLTDVLLDRVWQVDRRRPTE